MKTEVFLTVDVTNFTANKAILIKHGLEAYWDFDSWGIYNEDGKRILRGSGKDILREQHANQSPHAILEILSSAMAKTATNWNQGPCDLRIKTKIITEMEFNPQVEEIYICG